MKDLNAIEVKLNELKKDLSSRIEAIHKDTHHLNEPVEKDFAEQATQSENDDVLNALDNETQQTIYLIDSALKDLSEDRYGVCHSCNEMISDERLDAVPYAQYCIKCAEKNQ